METLKPKRRLPIVTGLIENFGFPPALAMASALFIVLLCLVAVIWVVQSAPPRTLVLTSGPEGSTFQRWADAYKKILKTHGVELEIRPSAGSLDNLQRLQSSRSRVDIGFVPSGLAKEEDTTDLVSLGSVAYQPLCVFYRSSTPISRLSELTGKRIAVGAVGSGTRTLAQALLQANGVTEPPAIFVDLDADDAATKLIEAKLDAVFLMGDSASIQTLRTLLRAPDIQLYNFAQADAYVRRYPNLNKIHLPQGSFDFGKNLPTQDVDLIGPTIELIARKDLNSALVELLLGVAKEVHGKSNLMQKRGEFPAPLEHQIPLSDDALRFYKVGKGFWSRTIPSFWLASLLNRILVAIVPLALVLIPTFRFLPLVYRARIQLRFYRWYRPLLRVERESIGPLTPDRKQELIMRLDEIEFGVSRLKVPPSFASQFYWLRSHIVFVRERLNVAPLT